MEVKKVCQTESVVLFWQKNSLSLHPGNNCVSVSVILVCPFFLPLSACWIWGKKGRKAVKARCLCPPFLLMINVRLFSEEKCLGIRAFEVNYLQAPSIFKSCRHDNSMWWQSHNICPTCTLIYLRQPSSPTDWSKKALKCKSLTWKCCLVKSRAQEVKLRWCCYSAASQAALVSGELCLLKHGRTEKTCEFSGAGFYFLFFISSKLVIELHESSISTEPSFAAATFLPHSKKDSLTKSFGWLSLLISVLPIMVQVVKAVV